MPKLTSSRAPNLDDATIERIVQILDGWSGKLSWKLFIEAITIQLHLSYARQTLNNHERIRSGFVARKKELTGQERKSKNTESPELQLAAQRIKLLEAEIARLTRENNTLLEQFVRWAYNASTRQLDLDFLNTPLPLINRDRTKKPKGIKS
ncbi:MAG: hypothetical protein ACTS9Y_16095 [Methylophilus sp.]|uniref:hypothetical protein n=1 Tax=Methylophilus sp. TaxID=29541 RepID=UPI003FA0578F